MLELNHKHGRIYWSDHDPILVTKFLDKIKEVKLPDILHPDLFSTAIGEEDKDRFDFYYNQFLGRQMVADFLYLEWDKYQEVPIVVTKRGVVVRSTEDYDVYHVVINLKPYLLETFKMDQITYDDQFVYRFIVDKVDHRLGLIEIPLHYTKPEEVKHEENTHSTNC